MAQGGPDAFLRAEEEADRLVKELSRLKIETESYRTAREALGQAAMSLSELSNRCAQIADRLGGIAEALRSIGMPELLRGLEIIAGEVATLRQQLEQRHDTHREEILCVQRSLGAQAARAETVASTFRRMVLVGIGLSTIALALLGWLVLTLARL
jgi:hypothetical protein